MKTTEIPKILAEFASQAGAADLIEVGRSTVAMAVRSGNLPSHKLGDGSVVVRIADAKHWAANRPKRGRPAKS